MMKGYIPALCRKMGLRGNCMCWDCVRNIIAVSRPWYYITAKAQGMRGKRYSSVWALVAIKTHK